MFDVLTYEKGCGVLRMLEQHIGPEVFRDGVRTYLKAHAYGNTVTSDLWDALENASGAPGARRHGHLHPAGRAPAGVAARRRAQPATLRTRTGARRRHLVHRDGVARAGRGAGAPRRRRAGRAGAPPGPRRRPEPIAEAGRRAWPWSTPAAGACSGSATRPRTARRWPSICPSSRPWSGPTCWPTPGRRPSPATRRCEDFLVLAARLGDEPEPAAWSPVGSALRPHQADRSTRARGGAPRGRRRAHRAHAASLGLRRHAGRERPHADAARARHQPPGHGGRRPRGPGRGGPALRRLAHRRWLGRSDPARHRVGDAGRRVAAPAARRLRRAAGALPQRVDTPGGDALPRGAGRIPRRRPVPAHVRPGHDRGAQPERVRRPRLAPGQPRRQPGGLDPADRELGRRARPLPEERSASHHRVDPRPVRRRRIRRGRHRLPRRPSRCRRARAGWPSRWSGSGSTWRSPPASGPDWRMRCAAAGTPTS